MDREDNPFINYHGRMRRIARRSVVSRLNPDPIYPSISSEPQIVPNYQLEPEYQVVPNDQPEYHPGPDYSDPLNDPIYAEPMNIAHPPAPANPISPHNSSVGDNFDYPDIQALDQDSDANSNNLEYVLDYNSTLIQALYSDLLYADQNTETDKEKYFLYLTRVRESYLVNSRFGVSYPSGDWVRSILYHFPRTHFWITKTNEILNEGHIENVCSCIFRLRHLVYLNM